MYIPRHHKTYLSRAATRAMAIDHPIGDPHGGPAYGERNDPVSAIISIGTMFGTYATAGTFAAMTLMQGLTFAGAALNLVGNISGNKTLSKIGMVAGLAGGIGSLAESAGMFSSGTLGETFGSAAPAGGAATGAPGAALNQTPTANMDLGFDDLGALDMAGQVPGGIDTGPLQAGGMGYEPPAINTGVSEALAGSAAPGSQLATPTAATAPGAPAPTGASPFDPLAQSAAPGAAAPGVAAPAAPTAPGTPATPEMLKLAGNSTDPIGSLVQQMGETVDPAYADSIRQLSGGEKFVRGVGDAGKGLISFANKNPAAAQMLSGAVSGGMDVLSGKNKAYIDYLEARGELDKAQADKLRYEIQNAERMRTQRNANYANVRPNIKVNPDAMKFSPNSGIIAGQMART